MKKHLYFGLILASLAASCSKSESHGSKLGSKGQLAQLEQLYSFSFPSNRYDLKAERWSYSSIVEGTHTTVSLVRFSTDDMGVSNLVASFSNRVNVLSGFRPVQIRELSARAVWWVPHEYDQTDYFHESLQRGSSSGSLDVYIARTATNKSVFVSSFLVEK